MAQQGLFTQGPSIDDLMSQRNQRSSDLQRQLMQQASRGAARPDQAQAASFLGSALGRALAGKMDGGSSREKLEAAEAAKKQAQEGYLGAAGSNSSETMFAQVKLLQSANHMAAATKMLALAQAKKKEEEDEAKALAKASKEAAEAADKEADDLLKAEAKAAADKEQLEYARAQDDLKQSNWQAEQDSKAPKSFETFTGEQLNAAIGEEGGNYPAGSIWQKSPTGKLTWVNKTGNNTSTNITLPTGYKAIFDDQGNVDGMEPIKGSKPYNDALAAENKTAGSEESKEIHTTAVMQSLGELSTYLEMDSLLTPILGIAGNLVSKTGASSERKNAEAALIVIQSNSGFGELQSMRDNSVTGGALGQVTEKELALLQGMLKSFSLDQTKENLVKKIKQFEDLYGQTVHGKAGWKVVKAKLKKEADEKKEAAKKEAKKGFGNQGNTNGVTMNANASQYLN